MSQHRVSLVGVGPGSPEYVTAEAQKAIGEAGILVGWDLNFQPVASLLQGKKVYLQNANNYTRVVAEAAEEARAKKETVAVLRIGDPCLSSGLEELLRVFHDFTVKIIPGISSIQMAAANARINLDESVIVSFHETHEELEVKRRFMLDAFRRKRHLIILTGQQQKPHETAGYLIRNGVSEDTPTLVGENFTLEDEKIFRGRLGEVIPLKFSWLSVMVVSQGKNRREVPG